MAQGRKHLSVPAPRIASIEVVRELLGIVTAAGGDARSLLSRARLPYSAQALSAPDWNGQITRREFSALYAEMVWAIDAQAARQEGRDPLSKVEFDLLCHCLIGCRTLRDVISRATLFEEMLAPRMGSLALIEQEGGAEFQMRTFRNVRNAFSYISDLTGLSTHYRLFSWLIGEEIRLESVEFSYPPLVSRRCASRLMPHPVTHDAHANALHFSAHYLDLPVIRTPAELDRLLQSFPFDLEEILSKDAPLSEKVRVLYHSALSCGEPLPDGASIARQFHISRATLKRHLADEGLTLRELKSGCRHDFARALLAETALSIGDVAQGVGFSDTAAFNRVFRQWEGCSPQSWRSGHNA